MDLLTGKIRPIYFKYLSAAFGSAMITSVYSIVDMAMVGQYQGPDGYNSSARAVLFVTSAVKSSSQAFSFIKSPMTSCRWLIIFSNAL